MTVTKLHIMMGFGAPELPLPFAPWTLKSREHGRTLGAARVLKGWRRG